ncbi:MAG: hypothetical protein JRI23_07015 [Deltaproteobacteria bacterium]|jgi:hypothetical protein|nr:hypothetical protein [Deltaproteobacteria bacterium]MBW2531338.1 hypothetical protein [Deltaproteobacteria bacterium]
MKPPWEGTWNGARYRPGGGDHLESYVLKATAPDAERAFWINATIRSSAADEPESAVAEAWAIAFDRREDAPDHVAVKHTIPFAETSFDERDLGIEWFVPGTADAMMLSPGAARGTISTGDHQIEWDLTFPTETRPLVTLPFQRLYTSPLPRTKQVSPYPDVRMSGTVRVDDTEWNAAGWYGMQGHSWGAHQVELQAWCHCNHWQEEEDLVLEASSARVRAGPVLLPAVSLVNVRFRGADYPFNALLEWVRTRADVGLRRFTFSAQCRRGRIQALVEAPVEDFVGLRYRNPSGPTTHCLNSKLATGRLRFEPHGQPPVELTTRAAALEVSTLRADHGVKMVA